MPELTGKLDTLVNGPEDPRPVFPAFDGDAWERVDWRRCEEEGRDPATGTDGVLASQPTVTSARTTKAAKGIEEFDDRWHQRAPSAAKYPSSMAA